MKIFFSILLTLTFLNANTFFKKIQQPDYINLYTISNHYANFSVCDPTSKVICKEPSFNESHPNLFLGYKLKEYDGLELIGGVGYMKNSINLNSFYTMFELKSNQIKNFEFGTKLYLANSYDEEVMKKYNTSTDYVLGGEYLINGGIFARYIYDKIYIDVSVLLPGILTTSVGIKF